MMMMEEEEHRDGEVRQESSITGEDTACVVRPHHHIQFHVHVPLVVVVAILNKANKLLPVTQ